MQALDGVSFAIGPGTCHGLVGENGAGKSTLGKILAGIERPDSGEILLDGEAVRSAAPREALDRGIGIVHQEIVLCENLSVAENLCLRDLPARGPFVAARRLSEEASRRLCGIAPEIDPARPAGELSVGARQLVQIAAALGRGARALVLDEPTSSLTGAEAERLFAQVRKLRSLGVAVLYVTHRLEEVFTLCGRVTVLRDGRHVETRDASAWSPGALVRAMIGRDLPAAPRGGGPPPGEELLRVEGLRSPGRFEGVSFRLRAGEILGLAGLVGAGRTEIAQAIAGLDPASSGAIRVRGEPAAIRGPRDALARGIALVPEDRKRHGLVLPMRVRENLTLPTLDRFRRLGFVGRRRERAEAERLRAGSDIRTAGLETPASSLSGGNQQKVVLAGRLAAEARVVLVDEPTRGVDVGAKAEIHASLLRLAAEGKGILLVSSDLPELVALSTRILVLRRGRIAGELPGGAPAEAILRLMAGLGG